MGVVNAAVEKEGRRLLESAAEAATDDRTRQRVDLLRSTFEYAVLYKRLIRACFRVRETLGGGAVGEVSEALKAVGERKRRLLDFVESELVPKPLLSPPFEVYKRMVDSVVNIVYSMKLRGKPAAFDTPWDLDLVKPDKASETSKAG